MNWSEYFIKMAELVSEKSKDRSTKVGVVIVGPDNEVRSVGFNGFPRGVPDNYMEYHERPLKYQVTEHAERNAIYNAARIGTALKGCKMYFNWEPCPCTDCARAIIQSGISEIIGYDRPFEGKGEQWEADLKVADVLLSDAGVTVRRLENVN